VYSKKSWCLENLLKVYRKNRCQDNLLKVYGKRAGVWRTSQSRCQETTRKCTIDERVSENLPKMYRGLYPTMDGSMQGRELELKEGSKEFIKPWRGLCRGGMGASSKGFKEGLRVLFKGFKEGLRVLSHLG
jgi:hypothetical protein